MDLLIEAAQSIALGYLVWKKWHAKPVELRDLVRDALVKHAGDLKPGRERLRARLERKAQTRG